MNWFKRIIAKFAKWLQPEHKFLYVEDSPENVKSKTIYIVGNPESPWLIAFNCPCGCQNLIQLNLLKDADPRWSFRVSPRGKINISPSVWRTKGCKSHFFVHKSKIDWVRNYESHNYSKTLEY